ncbi:MAG TPA: hypothetical protein VLU99_08240 [Nitrososphaerales archaeon]|nr:hypothetical protein [Nitrososphaerales archaeon]HUK75768.1 hypothetical protein [Nitrososphaerales archaeon]
MDSTEKIAVPLLIVQTTSVVFLWTLDTLTLVSQTIFTLFLAADLLAFALMAHVYRQDKGEAKGSSASVLVWLFVIIVFFVAALFVS